jgi:phage virion morphogenesis protein
MLVTVNTDAFNDFEARLEAARGRILQAIGEELRDSTKERFKQEIGPDGVKWKPNSPVTLEAAFKAKGGSKAKKAETRQKHFEAFKGKKKILRQVGSLFNSIVYQVEGDHLVIGSNMQYAMIHQFGGQAGRNNKVIIPARPFLGISSQDVAMIKETIQNELSNLNL